MKKISNFIFALFFMLNFSLSAQVITLDSPINGVTGQSIIPNFNWHGSDFNNDGVYKLEISTADAPNFDANIFFTDLDMDPNVGYTSYTEATLNEVGGGYKFPLAQNTIYYWRLTYSGSSNPGNVPGPYYSSIYHFRTFAVTNVYLHNPINTQTGVGINVNFSWSSDMGSASYKLQWIAKSTPPTPEEWLVANFENTLNKQTTRNLGGGIKYYWRVAVTNTGYTKFFAFSDVFSFTTSGGAVIPTANYPDGLDIDHPTLLYRNDPTFNWYVDGSSNYLKYNLEVRNALTDAIVISQNNITSMSYYYSSNLTPNIVYKWRVQSVYNDGVTNVTSDFSSYKYFKTQGVGMVYKPTLTYPINNNLVYTLTPYLQWCITSGVTGLSFRIEYWAEGGVHLTLTTDQYSYKLPTLDPGTTYHWKVQSFIGSTNSEWSDEDTFIVVGGQLTNAIPNYPKDNEIIYSTKPNFGWILDGNGLGITGYQVKVYKEDGTGIAEFNVSGGNTTNAVYPYTLEPGKTYKWKVAVMVGSTRYPLSSFATFRVYGAQLAGVPVLYWPIDATVYSNSQTFSWGINGSEANILGYELVYSYSDVFASGATWTIPANSLAVKTYTANNLIPGAIYYWKVRSWYGGTVYSDYSLVKSFLVYPGTSPMQPIVGGPNNMGLAVQNPVLTWIIPLPSASPLTYQVEVADNSDFNNSTVVNNVQTNQYTLNNPPQNKQYYWRVRSQVPSGTFSNYSNTGTFTLGDAPTEVKSENQIPVEFSLSQNYPNPFNPSTKIEYSINNVQFVTLKIYDVIGREIETLVNAEQQPGKYSAVWNASNYSSGVYYYEIKAGAFTSMKKMILVR